MLSSLLRGTRWRARAGCAHSSPHQLQVPRCRHFNDDKAFAPLCNPDQVQTVGCLGTGVIGGGWVCEFLRHGMSVRAYDPSPAAHERLLEMVDSAWPTLEKLGLKDGASKDNLLVTTELGEALEGVDCVQESVPEDEAIKRHSHRP